MPLHYRDILSNEKINEFETNEVYDVPCRCGKETFHWEYIKSNIVQFMCTKSVWEKLN